MNSTCRKSFFLRKIYGEFYQVASEARGKHSTPCLSSSTNWIAKSHMFSRGYTFSPSVADVSMSDPTINHLTSIPELPPIYMSDYTYTLGEECIAKYPAQPRGSSRLLRVDKNGRMTHHDNFSQSFLQFVGSDGHLVFNETNVVRARLKVLAEDRTTPSPIEMLLLTMGSSDSDDGLGRPFQNTALKVMIRKVRVQAGDVFVDVILGTKFKVLSADGLWEEDEDSDGNGTECIVQCMMTHEDDYRTLQQLLDDIGTVPIPPYLHREAEPSDVEAYNNVYANVNKSGSVAAPTAGLHFTNDLLERIGQDNISNLSLNVGAGTFKPVLMRNAFDHTMHSEQFSLSVGELRRIMNALENGKRLIVVGTTTCRTLETLYWCGVRRLLQNGNCDFHLSLGQVEWYHLVHMHNESISVIESFSSLVDSPVDDYVLQGSTRLMIIPQVYEFKVVHDLVTNFHSPDSTLILLIAGTYAHFLILAFTLDEIC